MPTGIYIRTKSSWNKGKRYKIGKISASKGRHYSPKTEFEKGHPAPKTAFKKGCKRPLTANSFPTGEKHPRWKGGITPQNVKIKTSIEYRLWREVVFARDNWTCQKCKKKGGRLNPHHIENFSEFPELRFAIDNGITFCEKCHKLFHKIYGRINNNKKQIEEFLKSCQKKN